MNTLNTGENFHYVPKEGDSAEIIANAIKVQKECLENNISSIKALVGHLVSREEGYVMVAHTNGTSSQFPAIPAANNSFYGETRLAA